MRPKYPLNLKYKLMDWLRDKKTMPSIAEIKELQKIINEKIENTSINKINSRSVSIQDLVNMIYDITNSTTPLNEQDCVLLELRSGRKVPVNKSFLLTKEEKEDYLTNDIRYSNIKKSLKIKKPDYLGVSKWDLKVGTETISAKIEDYEWLSAFQKRAVDIKPGDSMIALVQTQIKYGYDYEIISTEYTVKKVYKIIQDSSHQQGFLF